MTPLRAGGGIPDADRRVHMTVRLDGAGTPESAWQQWAGLRDLLVVDIASSRPTALVVLAAHPDDETLGAGGLIAAAGAVDIPIDVVVATAGEASHPASPSWTPAALGLRRSLEILEAVRALAPRAQVHQLRLPDGALADHRRTLRSCLKAFVRPGCWLVAPWRHDDHPDHDAAGEVAADVAAAEGIALFEYPIWAWHWASPDDGRLPWRTAVRSPMSPECRARKAAAIAAHRSQVEPLSDRAGDEVLVGPELVEHFTRPDEVFLRTDREVAAAPSLTAGYFDDLYRQAGPDPWGFDNRWYEQRKRSLTLAALPRPRFGRAFEAGCSIGVLTVELADRCDALLAVDVAATAVAAARERTAGLSWVQIEQRSVPAQWPEGELDLVVLSEVGYYCGRTDLAALVDLAARSLGPSGVLVACHWRHPVADYPTAGDAVHAALHAHPRLSVQARHVEEDFLLDVLTTEPAVSVARAAGLV